MAHQVNLYKFIDIFNYVSQYNLNPLFFWLSYQVKVYAKLKNLLMA
jgi:hypothetical protein